MKYLLKLSLIFILILSSCSKDNNDTINPDNQNVDTEALTEKLLNYSAVARSTNHVSDYVNNSNNDCYSRVYPITVVTYDNEEIIINSDEEFMDVVHQTGFGFEIVYPIDIILEEDGSQVTINNNFEHYDVYESCYGYDGPWDDPNTSDCFSLNFPLTVIDFQGDEIVVNSQEEFYTTYFVDFVFPISVTLTADGSIVEVNNNDEFFDLQLDCYSDPSDDPNNDPSDNDCFSLNFPITATDCNGDEIVINSEHELYTTCINALVYPLSLTLEDGTIIEINSDDDFDAVYNDCYGIDDCNDCDYVCFELVFPIDFVSESGTVVTINNEEELYQLFFTANELYAIVYPVSVTLEDGTNQTINNDDEFFTLFESCDL